MPGPEHGRVLGELVVKYDLLANLVPDAMLAALALRWENPLV